MYTLLPRFNINYIQYAENICLPKLRLFPAHPFCHSYLNLSLISGPPGTDITPFPYGLPNGDGAGVGCVGVGDSGLWGVGGRVHGDRVPPLLSSTQILFYILHKIKHKATFFLYFTKQIYSQHIIYNNYG
jgi:hypothetical protein